MKCLVLNILLFFAIIIHISACSESGITPPPSPIEDRNPYSLGKIGSQEDSKVASEAGLVLMGGSTDVDQAFRWMIEKSGGGDFVVIRVTGGSAYNSYINSLGNVNSVETLRIDSRNAANDERVFETLKNAEAVFIAGGDQSNYLRFWEDTKVEEALQYLIHDKKIPIGGTSAGCAIMGEFVYTGENGSIISSEALANPFDERLTVRKSSLINHPLLKNTITDQHFSERSREGRLVAFMARLKSQVGENQSVRAIAVDERTAVLIDKDGGLAIAGENQAMFLEENDFMASPEILTSDSPLTWYLDGQALKVFTGKSSEVLTGKNLQEWNFGWIGFWSVQDGELKVSLD